MLPENRLSTDPIIQDYLPPDDEVYPSTISTSLGGDELFSTGQNFLEKTWIAKYNKDTEEVTIESDEDAPIVLFEEPNITEISLAFDQNMRPTLALIQNDVGKLWWFDPQQNDQVFTDYPDIKNPRIILDDKRPWGIGSSDILFFYIRDDNLYYRQQRDRYLDEYLLKENLEGKTLWRVGNNSALRIMIELAEIRPPRELEPFILESPPTIII